MAYIISETECMACSMCAIECYFGAPEEVEIVKNPEEEPETRERAFRINQNKCVECRICAASCPLACIRWEGEEPEPLSLESVEIVEDACKGCSLCAKFCPVKAISGQVRQPFVIDQRKCIQCGVCVQKCKFNALRVTHVEV